jgi:hypothetical protein
MAGKVEVCERIAREHARLGEATQPVRGVGTHDLLRQSRAARVAENRAAGQRWLCLVEFYRRRLATEELRREASPHFALTARQETVVEVGELWGLDAHRVRKDLNVALYLCEHAPGIWAMCLAGQLDTYRATIIADTCRNHLATPEEIEPFMRQITTYLKGRLRAPDSTDSADGDSADGQPEDADGAGPMVAATVKQVRNKCDHLRRRLRPRADGFERKYADRGVGVREQEDGIAALCVTTSVDKAMVAERRLTLAARRRREQGDERTVQQLKADIAIDLITGMGTAEPVPSYARPVVNLTVPIQTIMGIADHPGELSGGTVVPASLARMIAAQPGSTWHRMLTDPAGHLVELSTKSYRATGPVWRQVVAEYPTCFRPSCDARSTEGDMDHRVAWPLGKTDTTNLWPGCRTDHRTKHAPGFGIEQAADGSYILRTAAGFRHTIDRSTHPASDDFSTPELTAVDGYQFSATDLAEAIEHLHAQDRDRHPTRPEEYWEIDFTEVLDPAAWDALAAADETAA